MIAGNPFYDGKLKETMIEFNKSIIKTKMLQDEEKFENLPKALEQEANEVMKLYVEIADIFIKNQTPLHTSYMVLAAMADAVFTYMTVGKD